MLGIKNRKSTGMEPWWKRRIESVKQLHKELGQINNTLIERKHIKKKYKDALEKDIKWNEGVTKTGNQRNNLGKEQQNKEISKWNQPVSTKPHLQEQSSKVL